MHLSTATMTAVLALGMSVSALPADPQQQQPPQEKHEQHTSGPSDQGEKACCVSSSTIESSTLARGLITNLLGASDQACATTSLIEKLNLLGFSEQKNGNHECTETSAKCHGDVVCFFFSFPFRLDSNWLGLAWLGLVRLIDCDANPL